MIIEHQNGDIYEIKMFAHGFYTLQNISIKSTKTQDIGRRNIIRIFSSGFGTRIKKIIPQERKSLIQLVF